MITSFGSLKFIQPGNRVRVSPRRPELTRLEISYDKQERTFHWDIEVSVDIPYHPDQIIQPSSNTTLYKQLTPEEITLHIDEETMARCLALSLTQAR